MCNLIEKKVVELAGKTKCLMSQKFSAARLSRFTYNDVFVWYKMYVYAWSLKVFTFKIVNETVSAPLLGTYMAITFKSLVFYYTTYKSRTKWLLLKLLV